MTPFEMIILCVIYLVCYGFMLSMNIKDKHIWFRILWAIMCFLFAIYAPIVMGGMLYDKLKEE